MQRLQYGSGNMHEEKKALLNARVVRMDLLKDAFQVDRNSGSTDAQIASG